MKYGERTVRNFSLHILTLPVQGNHVPVLGRRLRSNRRSGNVFCVPFTWT